MLQSVAEVAAGARTVVEVGAFNIKRDAKANVYKSAPTHNAHAAEAITYDTSASVTSFDAEIGYDKDKGKSAGKTTGPGGIGDVLEYGSRHNPPHRDLGRALDAEAPRFEDAISLLAKKLL
jgi:hypothetical protein